GVYFSLSIFAMKFTTSARAALVVVSVLPAMTLALGTVLKIEPVRWRTLVGALIAVCGAGLVLFESARQAPVEACVVDLILVGATLCMALYMMFSKPFIRRSSPLGFVTMGMGAGSACVAGLAWATGRLGGVSQFDVPQWLAVGYFATLGTTLSFYAWA